MTREEAINQLQDAKDGYKEYLTDEALDMAIKALGIEDVPTVLEADKGEVKPNMQEPREEFQPPCSDFDCDCYEVGEGGCAICVYDCEKIIEGEPCHKYKTRGRDKE